MAPSKGYAGFDAHSPLKAYSFERREVGQNDVQIDIKYCGVCHSDIHTVRNEWGGAVYPLVPGHEIVGIVEKVGDKVKHIKVGDVVGVGCMVNACGHCDSCKNHLEQFCPQCIFTYNTKEADGQTTKGGYANNIVVDEKFVLKVPANLPLAEVAPLLCAGITTYSPLRHWKVGKGMNVGIVGLGGLGHMAVKFAHAFGANVILFTTSPNKKETALKMGANEVVISKNRAEMAKYKGKIDFILDTVSAPHKVSEYMALLKLDGTLCMVGAPSEPHQIKSSDLFLGRKNLTGSLIGGINETQEMLDFCGKHNITCQIEMIPIQKINEAYERVLKSDVQYRFVIDMASIEAY